MSIPERTIEAIRGLCVAYDKFSPATEVVALTYYDLAGLPNGVPNLDLLVRRLTQQNIEQLTRAVNEVLATYKMYKFSEPSSPNSRWLGHDRPLQGLGRQISGK
jgi:hypothetical protein